RSRSPSNATRAGSPTTSTSSTPSGRCSPRRSTRVEPCSPSLSRSSSSTEPWGVAGRPSRAQRRQGRGHENEKKLNRRRLFRTRRTEGGVDPRRVDAQRGPVEETGRLLRLTERRGGGTFCIERSFKTNGQPKQTTTTPEINAARAGGGRHP